MDDARGAPCQRLREYKNWPNMIRPVQGMCCKNIDGADSHIKTIR